MWRSAVKGGSEAFKTGLFYSSNCREISSGFPLILRYWRVVFLCTLRLLLCLYRLYPPETADLANGGYFMTVNFSSRYFCLTHLCVTVPHFLNVFQPQVTARPQPAQAA